MKTCNLNLLISTLALSTAALAGCLDDAAPAPGEGPAAAAPESAGLAPGAPRVGEQHCIAEAVAHPRGEEPPASVAPQRARCFGTFAESMFAATRGAVQLAADATPDTLDESDHARLASASTYLISVEYLGLWWEAVWGTYTFTSSAKCSEFINLSVADLNGYFASNGWTANNSIGSVQTFNNCVHGYHYDYANWGGAVIDCPSNPSKNCYNTMGAMNDRTSSIRWSNY